MVIVIILTKGIHFVHKPRGQKCMEIFKFVCLLSNAVQFNPQVISFSTMYNSPYKISNQKIFFFVFFPKKAPKFGKILVSFEDKSTNVIDSIFSQ